MITFSIVFSGCGVILGHFRGTSEAEKIWKKIAIIVQKDEKGVRIPVPYSYSQTIEIFREIFMPHYEFGVEKFGEKSCYGMCKVYNAGRFGEKIRLILISKSEIRIWTGKIIDGKISESNEAQIFAEEIFQILSRKQKNKEGVRK
ncbi:hypothetical protein J7K91_01155 [bacterium]|nr:hypothetical protein [bacterium]